MTQARAPADGRNVILHFAEHSPAAIHAAGLGRITFVLWHHPGNIGVLTRRIDRKITHNESMLGTGSVEVSNPPSCCQRSHADLVFAGGPHFEAHQTIA